MPNTLLVTNKRVLSDQIEQLRRDSRPAKIVYHFGELFDAAPLLDLAWPDLLLVDDEMAGDVKASLDSRAESLGRYVYIRRRGAPAAFPAAPRGTSAGRAGHPGWADTPTGGAQ